MSFIEPESRFQQKMHPESLDECLSLDHPVRLIDAFVDGLNMETLGYCRPSPKDTGRPAYDPRCLLKLYIYGYCNKIRSSRKLMLECGRNVELFWLLGKLRPDFRTISDFRKDNAKAIRQTFLSFGKLCLKLNLYQKELLAVDGSKVRAVNSKNNCYNAEALNKKLERIDENITAFLAKMDEADQIGTEDTNQDKERIRAAIEDLTTRKGKYQEYLETLETSGESQILTTDPEARRMHSKDGFHCCYNVQTAVDEGSHLIVDYKVTNHNTDQGLLCEMAKICREQLDVETIEIVADKGYESRQDILDCLMQGTIPTVALKYDKKERLFNLPYEEADLTEMERSSTTPENIRKCLLSGVLPKCFEGRNVDVEVQGRGVLSCFSLNPDNTVTCPMGKTLKRVKNRGLNTIYSCKEACRQCPNRCTDGKYHKTVSFSPTTRYVPVMMYGDTSHVLNQIPGGEHINPGNHTLDRTDHAKVKVVIHIRTSADRVKQRKCLSEHPFGTVKWYHGAHYLLCKGKEKASAEMGLSFLAYNLIRAMNLVGVRKLIEAV